MKLVRLFSFLMLVLSLSVSDISAQITTAPLGTGTSSSATRGPFQRSDTASSSVYSRANIVYTSAELMTTLGIPSGASISEVKWDLGSNNVITATGAATLNIYMKNSSAANAVGDTWANITSGATLVGTYTFDATNNNFPGVKGFVDFPLSTPFVYTGGSIEIAVEWDCSGLTTTSSSPVNANKLFSGNGSLNWRWDNTAHTSLVYKAGSSSAPSDLTSGNIKSQRVNTQFVYTSGGGGGTGGGTTITTDSLGTGTSSSATRGPFQRSDTASSSVYSRANLVYTSTELMTTLGIPSGATISQVNWELGSDNMITATGTATLNIYMKNSSAANAVGDTWANITSGAILVGTYTFDATNNNFPGKGYMAFPLSVPFVYSGGSLEIAVDWDCSGLTTTSSNPVNPNKLFSGNGSLNWRWDNTAHSSLIYRAGSSSAPSDLTSGSLKSQRVNTQFVYSTGSSSSSDSVDITFQINTANIIATGGTVDAAGMYVAGGAGFGLPGDNPAADPDGDGIWTVTVRREKGFSSYYTFLNGNCPAWNCKEDIAGLPCSDPNNFDDRFLPGVYSDTTILACYGTCDSDGSCSPPNAPVDVTFNVNMNGADQNVLDTLSAGGIVYVSGSFNGWSATSNPMTDNGDGTWSLTVPLTVVDTLDLEWKFQINGWSLEESFADGDPCTMTDPSGSFVNRYAAITGATVLDTYCWNTCVVCLSSTNSLAVDDNLFTLHPSLVRDFTNITFSNDVVNQDKQVFVYNSVGELVESITVNNQNLHRLETSNYANGLYFVTVKTQTSMLTKRFVVSK